MSYKALLAPDRVILHALNSMKASNLCMEDITFRLDNVSDERKSNIQNSEDPFLLYFTKGAKLVSSPSRIAVSRYGRLVLIKKLSQSFVLKNNVSRFTVNDDKPLHCHFPENESQGIVSAIKLLFALALRLG